ncbi:hypothetical protein PVK06_002332 [Gossypium arboreum]|uniref:UBN2 domain-containing protein n=1 Tax=Gossypium arboreum TaxID=29729 RepID=A0ABR0R4E6_GOSAR|nr:hypothetical protein PVK06_002332 [Gossypium arboreum]
MRMKLFIQANDYEIWRTVTNGSSIPIKRVECVIILKEESGWDENDFKKEKLKEEINEMFNHFTHIINGLKALGKTYPNKEMVKKMLNSLPISWEPKMMAIEESKDLNSLTLDKLICSLLTYKMKISYNTKEIKEILKIVRVAFKSTTCEKDEESSNNDDDEMKMFAKIFKRFMRSNKGRQFKKKEGLKNESTKEKDLII